MRFSPLHHAPRHSPPRVAIAVRLKEIRAAVRRQADELRREREWRQMVCRSVWSSKTAVGCVESGELFVSTSRAALHFATYRQAVADSARTGKRCPTLGVRFVFLNGPRWQDETIWRNKMAVGCAETGELFESPVEAARRYGVSEYRIFQSLYRGNATVYGRLHFVFIDRWKRERYRILQREYNAAHRRKKDTNENRNRTDIAGRQERAA